MLSRGVSVAGGVNETWGFGWGTCRYCPAVLSFTEGVMGVLRVIGWALLFAEDREKVPKAGGRIPLLAI